MTKSISRYPNFFILGAAKAGTTALYDIIKQHPKIYLPYIKEPMFFSNDENFNHGMDWYLESCFSGAQKFPLRGEATPHYLYWAEKTAPRIAATLSNEQPRFIITLRDPIKRAYSWYWNMIKEGKEKLSFIEALRKEEKRLETHHQALYHAGAMTYGYKRGSDYLPQIKAFLRHFPRENFFFMQPSDIRQPDCQRFQDLRAFLGIDDQFVFQATQSNPARLPRSRWFHSILHGTSRVKNMIKKLLPQKFRYQLKESLTKANLQGFQYPPMSWEAEKHLKAYFTPMVEELEHVTGLDLTQWS